MADQPKKPKSWLARVSFGVVSIVVLAATQLVAWLGNGLVDPFFAPLTILQVVAFVAAGIQVVAFVPSFFFATEKYFDLTGSLTYIVCIGYSLGAGIKAQNGVVDPRAICISAMVLIWAARLGYFLFRRVVRAGKDSRFAELMPEPTYFLMVWALQALWIVLGVLPAFIVNATQNHVSGLVWSDIVGAFLYAGGLSLEAVADAQKSSFKANEANRGMWIDTGLWSYSRHPNYFGEIVLNFGMFVFSTPELSGSAWIAVLGPVWVSFLLIFVSGIPLLEKEADKRWGSLEGYQTYKKETSILIPWFRGSGSRLCCV